MPGVTVVRWGTTLEIDPTLSKRRPALRPGRSLFQLSRHLDEEVLAPVCRNQLDAYRQAVRADMQW